MHQAALGRSGSHVPATPANPVSTEHGSPLRRLGVETTLAASTSLVARACGFLKEIAIAAAYRGSGSPDVYLVAVVFIGLPRSIVLNAVQVALIAAVAGVEPSAQRSRTIGGTILATLALVGA